MRSASLLREYAGTFGPDTIEHFVHDSFQTLQDSLVQSVIPVSAERFTRARLRALAKIEGATDRDVAHVLFLCVHNAGRSQMAAGWLQDLAGGQVAVYSGGSEPAAELNEVAIEVMREVGIDISEGFPKPWTDEIVRAVDVVVTMGCGDAYPVYPGVRFIDWELDDPAGEAIDVVREIRGDLRTRVEGLIQILKLSQPPVA